MPVVELTHHYKPRGAAQRLFDCRDGEVLLSGPAGTGKSLGCLEKLNMMALLNKGMRGLIVRKTAASLGSSALNTWHKKVIPEAEATGVISFFGGGPKEPPGYRYENGSFIAIGGMDKPSKIMSTEYDVAFVQEATELVVDDWEAITTRLRNGVISFQQLMADCNPDTPTHFLKVRSNLGTTTMIESRHEDNPVLFDDNGKLTERGRDYLGKLDRLTGVRYLRLRKGLWVAAEGVVYEHFDPAIHLASRFELWPDTGIPPLHWTRWWSVDFGFTNALCIGIWAEDPDGKLYLYREIYHTKRTVDQHAADVMEVVSKPDPDWRPKAGERHAACEGRIWTDTKPRAIICDHDAEGRTVLAREVGIGTIPARKGVTDGIQATDKRFRERRIVICRDALVRRDPDLADAKKPTCTAEEFPGYVWQKPGIGAVSQAPKETPVKEDDHGMDQVRYLVAEREVGAPRLRSM